MAVQRTVLIADAVDRAVNMMRGAMISTMAKSGLSAREITYSDIVNQMIFRGVLYYHSGNAESKVKLTWDYEESLAGMSSDELVDKIAGEMIRIFVAGHPEQTDAKPVATNQTKGGEDHYRKQKIKAAERYGAEVIDKILRPLQPMTRSQLVDGIRAAGIAQGGYARYIVDGLDYLGKIEKQSDGQIVAR